MTRYDINRSANGLPIWDRPYSENAKKISLAADASITIEVPKGAITASVFYTPGATVLTSGTEIPVPATASLSDATDFPNKERINVRFYDNLYFNNKRKITFLK